MKRISSALLVMNLAIAWAMEAQADPAATKQAPLDYRDAKNWICRSRPGAACGDDLSATVLFPDGSTKVQAFQPAEAPRADCFYVYPTVSLTYGLTSAPQVTEAERRAVRQQAERFTSVCRLFAPIYRQFTVTSMMPGFPKPTENQNHAASELAEADILAAWDDYMAHDNHGRPIVLIGHSQGAMMVIRLLKQRIDGQSVRNFVSAIVPGAGVVAPKGKSVGGTFQHIPPCREATQTGCVIAFNTVRADQPLPSEMKAPSDDAEMICTNPASLSGGSGTLKPYLSSIGETIIPAFTSAQPPWTTTGVPIRTPFVMVPDLYVAECRQDEHGALLAVKIQRRPNDRRTGLMTGDWVMGGRVEPTMGLHIIDLNLTAGNLIDVLRVEIASMQEKQG